MHFGFCKLQEKLNHVVCVSLYVTIIIIHNSYNSNAIVSIRLSGIVANFRLLTLLFLQYVVFDFSVFAFAFVSCLFALSLYASFLKFFFSFFEGILSNQANQFLPVLTSIEYLSFFKKIKFIVNINLMLKK